jgi:hypothetical protein
VEHHDLGIASGMLYTAQQVGSALGISVLVALAATRTSMLETRGMSAPLMRVRECRA